MGQPETIAYQIEARYRAMPAIGSRELIHKNHSCIPDQH